MPLDHSGTSKQTAVSSAAPRPLVSLEGWARFEARARNRRIEHRLEAARTAIHAGRFDDARAALAELQEIDSSLSILPELSAQLALAERPVAKHRPVVGPYLAAAATFAALMLAAGWLDDDGLRPLHSFPIAQMTVTAPTVDTSGPPEATAVSSDDLALETPFAAARESAGAIDVANPVAPVVVPSRDAAVPPTGEALARRLPEAVVPRVAETIEPPSPVIPRELQPPPGAIVERTLEPAPPARTSVEPFSSAPAGASASPSAPAGASPPPSAPASSPSPGAPGAGSPPSSAAAVAATPAPARAATESGRAIDVDESGQVRAVLKQYQTAYDRLDAALAHDVWPAVNQAALARAFSDLESQSITFNNCDVRLRAADTADAMCTGSARYTPKVGSREPRVEPRVWNFTLRKRAGGWLIETARAAR